MFQFIEKIVSNRFQIDQSPTENEFIVTWKRASFFGIFLLVLWGMAIAYGIAMILGKENFGEMKIISLDLTGQIIYWGICFLVFIHHFFNTKSQLKFDGYSIYFQKRRITFKKHKFALKDLSEVETREVSNWGEDDVPGPRRELLKVRLRLKNGKVIKIDSFGEKDALELKKLIDLTQEKMRH